MSTCWPRASSTRPRSPARRCRTPRRSPRCSSPPRPSWPTSPRRTRPRPAPRVAETWTSESSHKHHTRAGRHWRPALAAPGASANVGRVRDPSVSPNTAGRLSPIRRVADLRRLRDEQFDVLVVGGGVTGAGAALDAASRGLKVALVEARDLAAGTSSRSSKLIHGGLRYLEQLELHLVHEALTERGLLTSRIAPHLVRPVPILVPLERAKPPSRVWHRAYYGLGVAAYDTFAGLFGSGRGMPLHRHLTRN